MLHMHGMPAAHHCPGCLRCNLLTQHNIAHCTIVSVIAQDDRCSKETWTKERLAHLTLPLQYLLLLLVGEVNCMQAAVDALIGCITQQHLPPCWKPYQGFCQADNVPSVLYLPCDVMCLRTLSWLEL